MKSFFIGFGIAIALAAAIGCCAGRALEKALAHRAEDRANSVMGGATNGRR